MQENIIRFEEKVVFGLRSIYRSRGYLPYRMGKFEEYELYARNRDFLVNDKVLTFNDTNGKLMALKPDVTLSIIRNGEDIKDFKQKVFYNENVYRVPENSGRFKEIMQAGLECIGDIGIYDIYEVISLAAESLACISPDFYIEISNLDIVYSVLSGACGDPGFISQALACISRKNSHDLKNLCGACRVEDDGYKKISALISLHGNRHTVIEGLKKLCGSGNAVRTVGFSVRQKTDAESDIKPGAWPEIEKMALLSSMLDKSPFSDRIVFDFSVINDMNYYNGFVFRGFIAGISSGVLAGGQYDNMMKKMNRKSKAIGFALYLDHINELDPEQEKYDVDYLLLYDEETDPLSISEAAAAIISKGSSFSAQKAVPEKLKYREITDLRKGGPLNA